MYTIGCNQIIKLTKSCIKNLLGVHFLHIIMPENCFHPRENRKCFTIFNKMIAHPTERVEFNTIIDFTRNRFLVKLCST